MLHVLNPFPLLTHAVLCHVQPVQPVPGWQDVVNDQEHDISDLRSQHWVIEPLPDIIPWQSGKDEVKSS